MMQTAGDLSHRPSLVALCADVVALRDRVAREWGIAPLEQALLWLPVVWTARGPLYAEAIGCRLDGTYYQPYHLPDRDRQPLYGFAFHLLSALPAAPGVYLVGVGKLPSGAWGFDRLYPFPAAPAIASVGVQVPDLFECHWLCLTGQPLRDVVVRPRQTD